MNALARKAISLVLTAAVAVFLACGCSPSDQPAASINGEIISTQDLVRFVNLMRLCNPDLDAVLQEGPQRTQAEREFLQILIDVKLVTQAMERMALAVDPLIVKSKTEVLLQDLLKTHYGGSIKEFNRRRKQLKLTPDDLELFPRHELQRMALFDHLAASVTEEEVLLFVEENPELLQQEPALDLYRIFFEDEPAARESLEKLQRGLSLDKLLAQLPDGGHPSEHSLGWVTRDYPFLEETIKELLFALPGAGKGCVTECGGGFNLYWISDYRPAAALQFDDVREEATLRKQYILYQDYYNTLWTEGQIEILHN